MSSEIIGGHLSRLGTRASCRVFVGVYVSSSSGSVCRTSQWRHGLFLFESEAAALASPHFFSLKFETSSRSAISVRLRLLLELHDVCDSTNENGKRAQVFPRSEAFVNISLHSQHLYTWHKKNIATYVVAIDFDVTRHKDDHAQLPVQAVRVHSESEPFDST
jgi:hypothetical protein